MIDNRLINCTVLLIIQLHKMLAIIDYIYGIQTKSVSSFFQRWTAVASIIFVYLLLAMWVWRLFEVDTSFKPYSANVVLAEKPLNRGNLQDFFYFPGIGVMNPSVNYDNYAIGIDPHEIADKCKLYGPQCMGFDTKGSLYLQRDRGVSSLQPFKDESGFYLKEFESPPPKDSGLPPVKASKTMCDELGGIYHKYYQSCTDFDPITIRDLAKVVD